MTAQMWTPSGAMPALPTAPIFLPFGSLAQPSTIRRDHQSWPPCTFPDRTSLLPDVSRHLLGADLSAVHVTLRVHGHTFRRAGSHHLAPLPSRVRGNAIRFRVGHVDQAVSEGRSVAISLDSRAASGPSFQFDTTRCLDDDPVTWLILHSISLEVDLGAQFEQAGRKNLSARDARGAVPCATSAMESALDT